METFQGLSNAERSSSRVLKPPGGGHSDIFGAPDNKPAHARPKYDQQNSSNICGALGTSDANDAAAQVTARDLSVKQPTEGAMETTNGAVPTAAAAKPAPVAADTGRQDNSRGRVPPGGFSTGFW